MPKPSVTVSVGGKQWVLPWDGSAPFGWDRGLLLRRRVPRLVRVSLEAWHRPSGRTAIRRSMALPGGVFTGDDHDLVGYVQEGGGFREGAVSRWAGTDAERLCRKVVQLTFKEENREPEFRALMDDPFWTEFLRDVRDLRVVAEVMLT